MSVASVGVINFAVASRERTGHATGVISIIHIVMQSIIISASKSKLTVMPAA
jgi:hypothetical protein